jgi:hypothetical protein
MEEEGPDALEMEEEAHETREAQKAHACGQALALASFFTLILNLRGVN